MNTAFDWYTLKAGDVPNCACPDVNVHCKGSFHKPSRSVRDLHSRVRIIRSPAGKLSRLEKNLKNIWWAAKILIRRCTPQNGRELIGMEV